MDDQNDRGRYKLALDRFDDEVEENKFGLDPSERFMEDDGFDAQSARQEWDMHEKPDSFLKRYGALLGFLIVGTILIWLLFNWVGTTRQIAGISGNSEMEVQLQALESRMARLEQRSLLPPESVSASSDAQPSEAVAPVTKDEFQRLAQRIDRLESMVNNLRTRTTDRPAQKPVSAAAKKKSPPKKATAAKKAATAPTMYTVKKGDTLYDIARRYKVSVDQVKKWNGLTGNNLSIGQKLKVTP